MRILGTIILVSFTLLLVSFADAQNACVQVCQQRLRYEVQMCNYPEKEPRALNACLATARANFDACRQGC